MNLNKNIKKQYMNATHSIVIGVSFCIINSIAVAGNKQTIKPSIAPSAKPNVETTISPSPTHSLQTKNLGIPYSPPKNVKSVRPAIEPRIQDAKILKNQPGKSGIVGPTM